MRSAGSPSRLPASALLEILPAFNSSWGGRTGVGLAAAETLLRSGGTITGNVVSQGGDIDATGVINGAVTMNGGTLSVFSSSGGGARPSAKITCSMDNSSQASASGLMATCS